MLECMVHVTLCSVPSANVLNRCNALILIMSVCLVDAAGRTLVHQNIPAGPDRFRELIRPYREGLAPWSQDHFGPSLDRYLVRRTG